MPGVKYDHHSIIRNGNHFIRLGKDFHLFHHELWYLIDGPWFEYLEEKWEKGLGEVHLRPYTEMPTMPMDECHEPIWDNTPHTIWIRKTILYMGIGKSFPHSSPMQLASLADRYENAYYDHRTDNLHKLSKLAVWQCNGGILPAWIKNPEWDENLEELFSFTTYCEYNRKEKPYV